MVIFVFNRISKFENLKSTDAATERCSEKRMFCNFLKTKVNYLKFTENYRKLSVKVLIFVKLVAF